MKVAIIGGGAAGLMAAATIHETDPTVEVFVIERNDGLGKKVIISGGGRCNVTTGLRDVRIVLTKYPRGGKFLNSAMRLFDPESVYNWFEAHGVPLKVEEDGRVFPQSDDGKDIVRVFEKMFAAGKVQVMLKAIANKIEKHDRSFEIFFKSETTPLLVDAVVLTTGGQAYRQTGSTGDGYAFAQSLGHTITKLAASLNSFYTLEKWPAEVSGLSFEEVKLSAKREKTYTFTGPMLFTHKGLSGPAVFALSSLVAFEEYGPMNPLEIEIDLFPQQTAEQLYGKMEVNIRLNTKKSFVNVLALLIPKSLSEIICREMQIGSDKTASDISKKDILVILAGLKAVPFQVIGRGAGDEFVTAGGIDTAEVNPSTMESKVCPGLYFAGEILDIDGYTGGFNLQASWATGHLAGTSIATQ